MLPVGSAGSGASNFEAGEVQIEKRESDAQLGGSPHEDWPYADHASSAFLAGGVRASFP